MSARLLRLLLPLIVVVITGIAARAHSHPNIILIVTDDLGYSDLASYGNTHLHTPFMDGLGKDGVRFVQAYATAPICGPSRAAIITGRYQQRFGNEFMPFDLVAQEVSKQIKRHYLEPWQKTEGMNMLRPHVFMGRSKYKTGLPVSEITIAQLLHENGYTTGLVGKWNLGNGDGRYPDQCGYDYSYYFPGALTRYVDDPVDKNRYVNQHLPWSFSELPAWAPRANATAIYEGRQQVKDTGYLTFSFAEKAIAFIEKNKQKPFFLTLTFNAPHDPFQAPIANYNRIKNVDDPIKRVYYAMIEALDDAVGAVLHKLKETNNTENTLIIFISDNGGATYTRATDNAPLRGGKCTQFDGGLRVPMFLQYPKEVHGGQVYQHPVSSLDIFTTIAAAAQVPLPGNRSYDGVDLLVAIKHPDSITHRVLYFRNGYTKAIRKDNWKLYINEHDKETFLFDLSNDPSELKDLSREQKEKVDELKKDLQTWEQTQTISPLWPSAADVIIDVNGKRCYFPT